MFSIVVGGVSVCSIPNKEREVSVKGGTEGGTEALGDSIASPSDVLREV